jgi:hypothetical protein
MARSSAKAGSARTVLVSVVLLESVLLEISMLRRPIPTSLRGAANEKAGIDDPDLTFAGHNVSCGLRGAMVSSFAALRLAFERLIGGRRI